MLGKLIDMAGVARRSRLSKSRNQQRFLPRVDCYRKKGHPMAYLYRPTKTKDVPFQAEIVVRKGERFARWKASKGRNRTAKLTTLETGQSRLVIESPFWRVRFRDGL